MNKKFFAILLSVVMVQAGLQAANSVEPLLKVTIPTTTENNTELKAPETIPDKIEKAANKTVKATKNTAEAAKTGTQKAADKTVEATKNATNKTVAATKNAANKTEEATKSATNKTVAATKNAANKTEEATKNATNKTVEATKNAANKTVEATKNTAKKTAESAKNIKDKAIDNTKEFIDDLPPYKEVTLEGLEKSAAIKTLKNERNELKSAYNSRIKDTDAKIKAAENSTILSDVQRQNRIYTLNKQKEELQKERDEAITKYNAKIKELKATK